MIKFRKKFWSSPPKRKEAPRARERERERRREKGENHQRWVQAWSRTTRASRRSIKSVWGRLNTSRLKSTTKRKRRKCARWEKRRYARCDIIIIIIIFLRDWSAALCGDSGTIEENERERKLLVTSAWSFERAKMALVSARVSSRVHGSRDLTFFVSSKRLFLWNEQQKQQQTGGVQIWKVPLVTPRNGVSIRRPRLGRDHGRRQGV